MVFRNFKDKNMYFMMVMFHLLDLDKKYPLMNRESIREEVDVDLDLVLTPKSWELRTHLANARLARCDRDYKAFGKMLTKFIEFTAT